MKNNSSDLQNDKIWLQYYIKIGILLCIYFTLLIIILFAKTNKILLLNDKMIFCLILVLTIVFMIQVNNYIQSAKNETGGKILEHLNSTTTSLPPDNSPDFIENYGCYYIKDDNGNYLRNHTDDESSLVCDETEKRYAGIYKLFKLSFCTDPDGSYFTNCWAIRSQFGENWVYVDAGYCINGM